MRKQTILLILALVSFNIFQLRSEETEVFEFPTIATSQGVPNQLRLHTNFLPWFVAIPNLGAEYVFNHRWSGMLDVWFCPWKISDKFSVKTVAILPELRWWVKQYGKGSFLNLHLDVAWFNVRANTRRYQDRGRPLLGAGVGYGYRIELDRRWGLEFEIGAGFANMKYDRYYNVDNGSLIDSRVTTYWGIDRASVALTYYLCDL